MNSSIHGTGLLMEGGGKSPESSSYDDGTIAETHCHRWVVLLPSPSEDTELCTNRCTSKLVIPGLVWHRGSVVCDKHGERRLSTYFAPHWV